MAKQIVKQQITQEMQAPSRVEALKRQASELQAKGTKTLETSMGQAKQAAAAAKQKTIEAALMAKKRTSEVAADRGFQVAAASAVSGGVVVGAGGAATGFFAGGALGAAVGVVPALFTFGLSIPVGAALGAGCGVAVGTTVGGATGFTGAGAIGYGAYVKRAEIAALHEKAVATAGLAKAKAVDTYQMAMAAKQRTQRKIVDTCVAVQRNLLRRASLAKERGVALLGVALEKSMKAKANAAKIACDKEVQATAASAAGGAALLGPPAAATGLFAGGAIGVAVGVVPALFTFGLSIPFCAVIGGGMGLVTGTTLGGTTGAIAGAGVYKKREAIRSSAKDLSNKATSLSNKALDSAKSLKNRLTGSVQ